MNYKWKKFWSCILNKGGRLSKEDFWISTFIMLGILATVSCISMYLLPNCLGDENRVREIGKSTTAIVALWSFVIFMTAFGKYLHNFGKSSVWILLILFPVINVLVLLVSLLSKENEGENQYGKNPKYEEEPGQFDRLRRIGSIFALKSKRLNRGDYLFCCLIHLLILFSLIMPCYVNESRYPEMDVFVDSHTYLYPIVIILIVEFLYLLVNRFHDINITGLLLVLIIFQPVGTLVVLGLSLIKGTEGDNKYGPDPIRKKEPVYEEESTKSEEEKFEYNNLYDNMSRDDENI